MTQKAAPVVNKPRLSNADILAAANREGYDPAAVYAVGIVEGSGDGFAQDGFPDILFERHIMYRLYAEKHGVNAAKALSAKHPDVIHPERYPTGGYGTEAQQRVKLDKARSLDNEIALQSCSWGRFQVLGRWWKLLGYKSVQDFVNAMCRSEAEHLNAFLEFCQHVAPAAGQALKRKDWTAFAIAYNGKSQKGYDTKIAAVYKQAQSIKF